GDEKVVYVMVAQPNNSTSPYSQGGLLALYKSKDNMLNFTKVKITDDVRTSAMPLENFLDVNMLGDEGSTIGALAVDPTNPNVLYVAGSSRYFGLTNRGLIRVDTGNMRDTTYRDPVTLSIINDGDDIDKAAAAVAAGGKYADGAPYTGEGVYWYNIAAGVSG